MKILVTSITGASATLTLALIAASWSNAAQDISSAPASPAVDGTEAAANEVAACPQGSAVNALVTVTGFKDRKGILRVELYSDKAEEFIARHLARIDIPTPMGAARICMPLPGPGRYAMVVLHDRNQNGRLNVFSDGYGFSHNPRLGYGKPSIEKVLFEAPPGATAMTIILNYFHGGAARPLGER
ncbi:MAG: DUF2141 domain-containing protein [Pseudomonadota bacterium]